VFDRAGLPEGLLRVIYGPGETGQALVASTVAKVFFTGSVEVGRGVGEQCARQLKGAVLELGGKDAMIVLPDASLEHAVAGALWGGLANAGQTCSGIERVYVMREVSERFIAGVVAGAQRLRVGDPVRWETEVGPMTSRAQFDTVSELVEDAVAAGAVLRCGGAAEPPAGLEAGAFYAPAVLTGVTHEMRIMREEIFGPVLPIVVVDSEDEAVALANDSEFGLGAAGPRPVVASLRRDARCRPQAGRHDSLRPAVDPRRRSPRRRCAALAARGTSRARRAQALKPPRRELCRFRPTPRYLLAIVRAGATQDRSMHQKSE